MNTSQQEYQASLLKDITGKSTQGRAPHKGLEVYQRNLRANACRALSITFPVVSKLVGNRQFSHLTHVFLHAHPPHFGDWGEWGDNFPAWIKNQPVSEEHPYLSDCATLDWLHHQCERSCNYNLDANSFLQLGDENAENGCFTCNPTLRSFSSNYPVHDIWKLYQLNKDDDAEEKGKDLAGIQHLLNGSSPKNVILWRQQWKVQVRTISTLEGTWLSLLQKGMPLGEALTALGDDSFSLEEWLPLAISQHKIIKFQLHNK